MIPLSFLGVPNEDFRYAIGKTFESTLKRVGYQIILAFLVTFFILFILSYSYNWPEILKALFSGFSITFGASLLIGIITAYYQEIPAEDKFDMLKNSIGELCSVHSEPIVGIEIASDKAYSEEFEGASKIWMFFLTGRTVIEGNLEYLERAINNTTDIDVKVLVANSNTLNQLPEKAKIGLCPVGSSNGLIIRLEETLTTVTNFKKNLNENKKDCFHVKETNFIPTAHMIIVEKQGHTHIWYTPYMPGIGSRETYRYVFCNSNSNTDKFLQSFNEAWREGSDIC